MQQDACALSRLTLTTIITPFYGGTDQGFLARAASANADLQNLALPMLHHPKPFLQSRLGRPLSYFNLLNPSEPRDPIPNPKGPSASCCPFPKRQIVASHFPGETGPETWGACWKPSGSARLGLGGLGRTAALPPPGAQGWGHCGIHESPASDRPQGLRAGKEHIPLPLNLPLLESKNI